MVHGKATYEWQTNDIRVHTSDIRMAYRHIRVTYEWHTSVYEWHTSDIRMTWEYIRVHISDIQMTYEYMRVTYGWHPCTYEWHTRDMEMTYEWHTDDMRFERKIKLIFLKLFDNSLSKYLICKRILCMRCLFWVIYQNQKGVWN